MRGLDPIEERPATLAESAYQRLRDAIIARHIGPGERVTETGLAAELGISKTPVREALLRLMHVGLVQTNSERKAHVVVPSSASIRAAYELRTALEAHSARLAASRAEQADLDTIVALADASREAADSDKESFPRFDRRFHLAIVTAARNPHLEQSLRDALDLVGALRSRDVPKAEAARECASQHQAISRAIEQRAADQASDQMRTHLAHVQQLVLTAFDAQQAPAHASAGEHLALP